MTSGFGTKRPYWHGWPYVRLQALTGRRPQVAIASALGPKRTPAPIDYWEDRSTMRCTHPLRAVTPNGR